jgi:hypothetical protein
VSLTRRSQRMAASTDKPRRKEISISETFADTVLFVGWVTVRRGTQSHAFDLVFDANPSVSAVRNYLGPIDDSDLQSDLNVAIVGSILQACLLASTDFERARLDHLRPGEPHLTRTVSLAR